MSVYYNEIDRYAAQWLRNLIAAGHIAAGDVDERSVVDVRAADLAGYRQCHFFAGIGGWSYALRLAGWPDDRAVWTGSCPCQPFSSAGQRKGHADERHLWPAFYRLIAECRPATVFGEQVASKDGREWLSGVRADLEAARYAVGAADLCAAGVGAFHIRQRLYWVADADGRDASDRDLQRVRQHGQQPQDGGATLDMAISASARRGTQPERADREDGRQAPEPGRLRDAGRLGDTGSAGSGRDTRAIPGAEGVAGRRLWREPHIAEPASGLGDANAPGLSPRERAELSGAQQLDEGRAAQQPSRSPWADPDWIDCRDGKRRPVEPGTFPLVDGAAFKLGSGSPFEGKSRVGMLRAYGNAIVPQVAAEFVSAFLDCQP